MNTLRTIFLSKVKMPVLKPCYAILLATWNEILP